MNLTKTIVVLCLLYCYQQAMGMSPYPSGTSLDPLHVYIEESRVPKQFGPAELSVRVTSILDCPEGEMTLTVITKGGLAYHGPVTWPIHVTEDSAYTTTLMIEIPPNDTSALILRAECGNTKQIASRYFVTTGEQLVVRRGDPRGFTQPPKPPDTTTYRIRLDLRDKEHYEFFERYEEQLGSIEPTTDSGFYLYRTTREGVRDLLIEGFKLEPVDSIPNMPTRPPRPKPTRTLDSTSRPRSQSTPPPAVIS